MEVNIHHAKTNLSRLIVQAEAGEEIIIARAGKPAVRLVPVHVAKPRKFKAGALKGRMFVPDNFLDRDPELEALFYDGPVFSADSAAKVGRLAMTKAVPRKKPAVGRKTKTASAARSRVRAAR